MEARLEAQWTRFYRASVSRQRIVLASVLAAFLLLSTVDNAQTVFDGCGLVGDAKQAVARELNPLKNRDSAVNLPVAGGIGVEQMLAPGDDSHRFASDVAAVITGFVVKEKLGGIESCNCHATDPLHRDRHIYVGRSRDAPLNQCVIVEVTPRFYAAHPDWMDITLLPGHLVTFTGLMFFDAEHKVNAENTNPGHKGNWRATCWELHPVTDIRILQ